MARDYTLRARAEHQRETRRRIVDAAIELHQEIGPRATSMADIAERAGVGRVTVYRHFADEDVLARACSGLYFERHPAPDVYAWRAIADPRRRLRTGLAEAYGYHATTERMMSHVLADARDHEVMRLYHGYWDEAAEALTAAWRARGRRRRLLRAGIRLALDFDTWRSLVRDQSLELEEAVDVAARLAGQAAKPSSATVRAA